MKALNHKKGTWEISSKEKEQIFDLANRNIQLMSMTNALSDFVRHKDMIDEFDAWVASENERMSAAIEQDKLDKHIEAMPDEKPKRSRKKAEKPIVN